MTSSTNMVKPVPTSKPAQSEQITIEQFQRALPKGVKAKITPDMVNHINQVIADPAMRENYRENLLSYTGVMKDGKFKIQSYIDAVRYVSHKLLGASNIEAYAKTFPERYQRLIKEGADEKTISSYCAAYNKNLLVNKIMEQTLVPQHVLNADLYQKALNVQAALMVTAKSEKVRTEAANSLLNHLKMPETAKVELDVNVKQDSAIDDLRATTMELVKRQRQMLEQGNMTPQQLATAKLVRSEPIEGEFVKSD